jgi:hypothetical protein
MYCLVSVSTAGWNVSKLDGARALGEVADLVVVSVGLMVPCALPPTEDFLTYAALLLLFSSSSKREGQLFENL